MKGWQAQEVKRTSGKMARRRKMATSCTHQHSDPSVVALWGIPTRRDEETKTEKGGTERERKGL